LGTAAGAIVTVLVNGAAIAETILHPSGEQGQEEEEQEEEEEEEEPRRYTLDIRTEEERTTLEADGEDTLWIYGQVRCDDPEVDTEGLTQSLSFRPQGPNTAWFVAGEPQMSEGFKAVQFRARPPIPDAELASGQDQVLVSTTIEGTPVSGPVLLSLELYELLVEALD
jgi:hypothetical protein